MIYFRGSNIYCRHSSFFSHISMFCFRWSIFYYRSSWVGSMFIPLLAMILGSTLKRRLRTQQLAAAGRVLSNLDNEYKMVNFSFR